MLTFTPVTQRDIARLRRYYKSCEYQLCEYSALVKLMWRSHLHPSWAEGAGCLIVRNFIDGQYCFDYPVPGPDGDEEAALTLIEDDCRERDIPLVLSVVPQDKAERLAARYPYFRFSSPRVWRDYIYAAEDLCDFAGRRYSGQRNHINKFRKLYPDAAFRPLGKIDLPLITQFFRDYEAVFTKASDSAKNELRCAEKMLRMTGSPHFLVGGMELDGRLLSVAMAERCGDTLQIHIEKALYGYEGVYPATVQAFAQEFAVDGVRWLNREDDAGDKGLRTSKLQYLPDHLGAKLRFDVLNELVNITEIPTLTTARLTLDALTDADKTAYAALCLDDDRNRWWGYDFRKDYDGTPYEDYFLAVAREDCARSRAVNFAVRLDGALIGEVVLYRFDSRGGAELGCRVSPGFAGHGYGTEAFAAVAEWIEENFTPVVMPGYGYTPDAGEWRGVLQTFLSGVNLSLFRNSLVQGGLNLLALGLMFGLYTILRRRERESEREKAKAKSYFFSTVSHDIRTPLNAIIGYSEMLKTGFKTETERKEAINSILVSSKTLLGLVNDVLDISKLESGKMEILPRPTD